MVCGRDDSDVWYVGSGDSNVYVGRSFMWGGVRVMCGVWGGVRAMYGMWEVVTVTCMWGGVRVMSGMREGEGDEWYEGGQG